MLLKTWRKLNTSVFVFIIIVKPESPAEKEDSMTTTLVNVLSVITAVGILGGLILFIFWIFSTSVHYAAERWPGIVGAVLMVVGLIAMIPAVGLEQKAIKESPIVRAEAFTVEVQEMPRCAEKVYVVTADECQIKFSDFEIGGEEFVEYKATEIGTTYPERLVVSEDTAEILGRVQIGK